MLKICSVGHPSCICRAQCALSAPWHLWGTIPGALPSALPSVRPPFRPSVRPCDTQLPGFHPTPRVPPNSKGSPQLLELPPTPRVPPNSNTKQCECM